MYINVSINIYIQIYRYRYIYIHHSTLSLSLLAITNCMLNLSCIYLILVKATSKAIDASF